MEDERVIELQQDIYTIIEKYIEVDDNMESLLLTSGLLLKTAIQLYTVGLSSDEEVERVLEFAKESIEVLRESTSEMIDVDKRTLH
tara:strand:- start:94 stop:351 length:258 start_codon:yes stop_codon:yes gene_type:complete